VEEKLLPLINRLGSPCLEVYDVPEVIMRFSSPCQQPYLVYHQSLYRTVLDMNVAIRLLLRHNGHFTNTRLVQTATIAVDRCSFVEGVVYDYSGMQPKQPGTGEWTLPSDQHGSYSSYGAHRGMPKDMLLIVHNATSVATQAVTESWEALHKDSGNAMSAYLVESGLCMDGWLKETAAEADTPLHNYYRQLEGYVWTVWRVRNPLVEICG